MMKHWTDNGWLQAAAFFIALCVLAIIWRDMSRREDEFRAECAKRGGRAVVTRDAKMCLDPGAWR